MKIDPLYTHAQGGHQVFLTSPKSRNLSLSERYRGENQTLWYGENWIQHLIRVMKREKGLRKMLRSKNCEPRIIYPVQCPTKMNME